MAQSETIDVSQLSIEAQAILGEITQQSRTKLLVDRHIALTDEQQKRYTTDIARLQNGEPLAYILGHWPFLGLELAIQPNLLVPRPETEWWVQELAIPDAIQKEPEIIADIGCGTGGIGISIVQALAAREKKPKTLIAVDTNPIALETTLKNWETHKVSNCTIQTILQDKHDWSAWLKNEQVPSFVCSNPPYLDIKEMDPVGSHEDHDALFTGENGMESYRKLFEAILQHDWYGTLWLEIDPRRNTETLALAKNINPKNTKSFSDQFGRQRVLQIER